MLVGLLTQLLHAALVLLAAPLLLGTTRWLGARLLGRRGPSPMDEWRSIALLLRKQPVLAEHASAVTSAAPYAAAAATLAAAMLVPTFARGMLLAPLADILVVAGLLASARCAAWLAALDAGTPLGGMGAARTMRGAVIAEPVLLVATLVLAMLTGQTNLDVLWSAPLASPTLNAPLVLCFAALALAVALETDVLGAGRGPYTETGGTRDAMLAEGSGRHLALWQLEVALRLLVWLSLLVAMFLPAAAPAGAGPLAWGSGLLAWGGMVLGGCLLLVLVVGLGPALRPLRGQYLGWLVLMLALLGAALAFVSLRAA